MASLLLTDELQDVIRRNLRSGCAVKTAVRAAGVTESTYSSWMAQARIAQRKQAVNKRLTKNEVALTRFLAECEDAYHQVEVQALAVIRAASAKDWRAAAWLLERRNPKDWAPPTVKAEITGKDGGPIEVQEVMERALDFLDVTSEIVGDNGSRALEA